LTPAEFRAARQTLGLTQYQLAAILGMSNDQISRMETGAPRSSVKGSTALAMRAMLILGLPETWEATPLT